MKRLIGFLLFSTIIALVSSCSYDINPAGPDASVDPLQDGIEISLSFPEMTKVSTRTLMDVPTKSLDEMDLFLFVFDGSRLLQTIHIPSDDETRKLEAGVLKFTAYLPQTDEDATIHIVAIDDGDKKFAAQIDANGYGIEDTVMPGLSVNGGKDVYWQRVELGCKIKVKVENNGNDLDNIDGTENLVKEVFKNPIPLIRNFAKVSIESSAPNFEILGWTIVNERDGGSVVPWFSLPGDPDVLYADYFDYSMNKGRSYNELTNAGYHGVSQTGTSLKNTLTQVSSNLSSWNACGVETKYLYERRVSSVNPLYILVYGRLYGSSASYEDGYYKLALGHTDKDTGLFTEYNVIRNIEYHIDISAVSTKGSDTPAHAAAGPAFNNVSGDVTTKSMTQISDGVDRLYVSFTSWVVTESGKSVDFKYKYVQNITSSKNTLNNFVNFQDLVKGDVIQSFSIAQEDDEDGWRSIHIVFNDPSSDLKQQQFIAYVKPADSGTGNIGGTEMQGLGLSRTINLVLRNPWDFVRMETFPGQWNDDREWPDYDPDDAPTDPNVNYYVGAEKGAPLTIFYELPAGLPEAIFPLTFRFEADKQNIENDGIGTAVVRSLPSLFPNVLDYRISYEKTLRWEDYAVEDEGSTLQSRIQRARFVTTTNISSLVNDAYITTVILHNDYFNDIDDKFERNQSILMDKDWNFSDEKWEKPLSNLTALSSATSNLTISVDGLYITNGGTGDAIKNGLQSGSTDQGTYVQMGRTDNKFTYAIYYPESTTARSAVLRITASSTNNNGAAVKVTAGGSTSVIPTTQTFTGTTKTTQNYTIVVPQGGGLMNLTISPNNNTAVRFYRIEFFPLGDANDATP